MVAPHREVNGDVGMSAPDAMNCKPFDLGWLRSERRCDTQKTRHRHDTNVDTVKT